MKHISVIILSIHFMLIGITSALNGSYCCMNTDDDVLTEEDGTNVCFNAEENSTITFSLSCSANRTLILPNTTDFLVRLNPDATLAIMLDEVTEWTRIPANNFCIGYQTQNDSTRPAVVAVCQDEEEPQFVSEEVLGYCMATSSVFLALTAFVYISLPELRDVQGKSIISLCSSLSIANALMCVLKVMEYSDMTWCAIRGFLAYLFIISSFFWMNAIAIQILINIKRSSINYGRREFLWYAMYAWGVPILLTVALIIINYHPGHHEKPGIGHTHCWFLDLKRMWIYMYSVISILMAANVGIFVYTSVFLWKYTFSSSHVRALKYKFSMMLRLFIIMGLPWIFEMVTSLAPAHIIWVVTDVSNCLQGIIIFLTLVVFRRKVIKALHKRNALCCLNGVAERYLAVGPGDEDDIITHTIAVPLEEK